MAQGWALGYEEAAVPSPEHRTECPGQRGSATSQLTGRSPAPLGASVCVLIRGTQTVPSHSVG